MLVDMCTVIAFASIAFLICFMRKLHHEQVFTVLFVTLCSESTRQQLLPWQHFKVLGVLNLVGVLTDQTQTEICCKISG